MTRQELCEAIYHLRVVLENTQYSGPDTLLKWLENPPASFINYNAHLAGNSLQKLAALLCDERTVHQIDVSGLTPAQAEKAVARVRDAIRDGT